MDLAGHWAGFQLEKSQFLREVNDQIQWAMASRDMVNYQKG